MSRPVKLSLFLSNSLLMTCKRRRSKQVLLKVRSVCPELAQPIVELTSTDGTSPCRGENRKWACSLTSAYRLWIIYTPYYCELQTSRAQLLCGNKYIAHFINPFTCFKRLWTLDSGPIALHRHPPLARIKNAPKQQKYPCSTRISCTQLLSDPLDFDLQSLVPGWTLRSDFECCPVFCFEPYPFESQEESRTGLGPRQGTCASWNQKPRPTKWRVTDLQSDVDSDLFISCKARPTKIRDVDASVLDAVPFLHTRWSRTVTWSLYDSPPVRRTESVHSCRSTDKAPDIRQGRALAGMPIVLSWKDMARAHKLSYVSSFPR